MASPATTRRGITPDLDAAWEMIESAHTGILTTLRADGRPVTLPVWFIVRAREIFVRTPPGSRKIRRITVDPRASFLVERGAHWTELAAVTFPVEAAIVPAGSEATELAALIEAKYAEYALPASRVPRAVAAHYAEQVVLRLTPNGSLVAWDNSLIKMQE